MKVLLKWMYYQNKITLIRSNNVSMNSSKMNNIKSFIKSNNSSVTPIIVPTMINTLLSSYSVLFINDIPCNISKSASPNVVTNINI